MGMSRGIGGMGIITYRWLRFNEDRLNLKLVNSDDRTRAFTFKRA